MKPSSPIPPASPPSFAPKTPTSTSSLHPPSSFRATSLLRRASGALRGAGAPSLSPSPSTSTPTPTATPASNSTLTTSIFSSPSDSSPANSARPYTSTTSPTSNTLLNQEQHSNNNTLTRRLSLTFRRPSKASLDALVTATPPKQPQQPHSNATADPSISDDSLGQESASAQIGEGKQEQTEAGGDGQSPSFPASKHHLRPASTNRTSFSNSNPNSNSNSNPNFLSPKAAALLLSPEERAFRGGMPSTSPTSSTLPTPISYHSLHLTPEEAAFRGVPYVPIPSSPNSALANLATGTPRRWERFRNAVSSSKSSRDNNEREDGSGDSMGLSLRGFMRSPSPAPRSPSSSPEFYRNQAPTPSSKAEKLLGISSPTTTTLPASLSKAEKLLGISSSSSSSASTANFNSVPSKAERTLGMGGVVRSRATSSASRSGIDAVEMQRNKTEPTYYAAPPNDHAHPYLNSRAENSNRSRSGSTASSFFAEDSSNTSSSSSFLGLGLSHTESESNPYNSEQESNSHSDFLNLGREVAEASQGFPPEIHQWESESDSSSPRDRTPSAEWGTFLPSLTKKASKDRIREAKEREKEKEKERIRQLAKLKERRKDNERRLWGKSHEEVSSDAVKDSQLHQTSKSSLATDYGRDPTTPIPPSLWSFKSKEDQLEHKSLSPTKWKSKTNPSTILTGSASFPDSTADSSLEKSKSVPRVHASDLMAQFNLEKTSSPKERVKTHSKARSSSSIERFETPVKNREVSGNHQHHQRQDSTPKPPPVVALASSRVNVEGEFEENQSSGLIPQSIGQYVPVQTNLSSHRKPVRGLFDSLEQDSSEQLLASNQVVHLRPHVLTRADSVSSRKRISSLLCEGFDLVLDSDELSRIKAQEALQAIVDDDDAGTCASSDFEGEEGMESEREERGKEASRGGYVSAEEGEHETSHTEEKGDAEELESETPNSSTLQDSNSPSPTAASFVTAQVKPDSQKKLVSRKSPQDKLLPLPPSHSLSSSEEPQSFHHPASSSRALVTLNSLPPLSSLVQECLSADSATAALKPKLWSENPILSNSNNPTSTSRISKLLSSSSSKDQIPKSWVGYVRSYSRGEFDLSNPPPPRAAPIVSFSTPRMSSSPSLVSPSLLGTGRSLQHRRSSSSLARFDGTFERSNSPNIQSPLPSMGESRDGSSPLPIPFRNGAKTPPPMSSASPAFKSPRKSASIPRLSFASASPRLDRLGQSFGSSPGRDSGERMRMSRDDEDAMRREAEEVSAVGGEGDIRAPRPPFESQRQESASIYKEALRLGSSAVSSRNLSTTAVRLDGLQLIAQRLAQELDVECSGITLLDDSNAYLLASVGIESNRGLKTGLGFKWSGEERRASDPKLSRSPSGKQLLEGLGVEFEEEEREELADSHREESIESHRGGCQVSEVDERLEVLPRDRLFDAHTILSRDGQPFVVSDTLSDWRFERREGASNVRFYAGVSILSQDGMPIGTVFVAHTSPRSSLKREDKEKLLSASKEALVELERLRGVALADRLKELDQSLLAWARSLVPQDGQHRTNSSRTPSDTLASIPTSPMTLAARRGAKMPTNLSVPPSPNPNRGDALHHPASSALQAAVNSIGSALSGLVYIARVGSDPLKCSVVVSSDEEQVKGKGEDSVLKAENSSGVKLNPDACAHLCALAATKRGLSIHRDPTRVEELLGLSGRQVSDLARPFLESAMIVPAGLKEGGRMWRGTEGWVLGVALGSTKTQRLGPEVSIYLLRFASLLAPLLLEGPRSPSPLVVPPRSSSNHSNAEKLKKKSKPGELLNALKSAPLPPLPLNTQRNAAEARRSKAQHPYSHMGGRIPEKQDSPSRSPLLPTQPLSAPPSTNSFPPLSSPNVISIFSQRNRKAIPQASPPPNQPLPLPPLPLTKPSTLRM